MRIRNIFLHTFVVLFVVFSSATLLQAQNRNYNTTPNVNFEDVDANSDGVITRSELDDFRSKNRANRNARRSSNGPDFNTFDMNGDGQITYDEWINAHNQNSNRRYNRR